MPDRRPCLRKGLGIVELLIALAITATLLASVAIAFHASLNSFDTNQQIATTTQCARVVLNRMMREARQADDVATGGTWMEILPPEESGPVSLLRYEVLSTGLWYRRTENGQVVSYPLIPNADGVSVESFTCHALTESDPDTGEEFAKIVSAQLVLRVGQTELAVNASTSPRRNQQW